VKTLTIRKVSRRLADALEREKKRRGTSLNQTVLDLLGQGVGVGTPASRSNGLRQLAATWSEDDLAEFEYALAATERVDEELWR
jgi:hypothetical protein